MFVAGRSFRLLLRDSEVTFWRDSLYAVGGSLTVACQGYLSPVENINNCFQIDTDSTLNDSTKIPDLLILIDRDPPNALFSDSLGTDRNRAIAWAEAAGTLDITHCHNPYNPLWNHYWDTRISGADTCYDTRTPCENAGGTDTGIMQIYRTVWDTVFTTPSSFPQYPAGFTICKRDSLEWNWMICIHNGRWILEDCMPARMKASQQAWPESCSYADCDSVPDMPNQEDLANYGYHAGEGRMRIIDTEKLWKQKIFKPNNLFEIDWANYIKNVRRIKYNGNLW